VVAATAGGAPNIGQAVAAGQQVVDHGIAALEGVFQAAQAPHLFGASLTRHLTGLYNGWTGSSVAAAAAPDVSIAAQQAAAAAATQAQQTAAINAQLPHFYGGSGAAGNNYSLPLAAIPAAGFTTISTGLYLYGSQLLTDSQTVSALWNKVLAWTSGVGESRTIFLRSNVGATTYCYAKMHLTGDPGSTFIIQSTSGNVYTVNDPNAAVVIEIGCYVAGVKTVLQTWNYPLWTFYQANPTYGNIYLRNSGYYYYLDSAIYVFTFEATAYDFIASFAGSSFEVIDSSHVSQKGSSYLSGGFSESVSDSSLKMSWDFYDSGPTTGPGTAYVATGEQTASTSYTDLATTTDQVTVNIGSSGLALVSISALLQNFGTNNSTFVAFAVSGASTIAADDSKCFLLQAYAAGANASFGASFLMTGLNVGATTFKMKYRVDGNTGEYYRRNISVIPL
jgi:hypothetical protein